MRTLQNRFRFALAGGLALGLILWLPLAAGARKKPKAAPAGNELSRYIQAAAQGVQVENPTLGSLWNPHGPFSDVSRDYKAERVGDLVTINIAENTAAASSGTTKSARNFTASSSLSALFGPISNNRLQNLFTPNSSHALSGAASTASSSVLTTSLTGVVTQVLPNGFLVVEAGRDVLVDNQRQHVILRGIVRPGDLAPDNSVLSNQVAHLQVEVVGKGVISDGDRPPHIVTRLLLKILGW